MSYTHIIDAEFLHENGESVIQTNEVRIEFGYDPFVPATYSDPAEGGTAEFLGAKVLGNRGKWITLHPGDPLYAWAEAYFSANEDEFIEAGTREDAERYWDDADRRYEQRRDDLMMGIGS